MTIYRLYTESFGNLSDIVSAHFDGATLSPAIGLWKGTQEASTVIEIAFDDSHGIGRITALAADITETNNQESVMIVSFPATVTFHNREKR